MARTITHNGTKIRTASRRRYAMVNGTRAVGYSDDRTKIITRARKGCWAAYDLVTGERVA